MIYLDNAATTALNKNALDEIVKYSCNNFFNPSAIYKNANDVKKDIDSAKEAIAKELGVEFNDNIIFTGSATEANNLAIKGSFRKNFGKMIFSMAEHPSVYNVALALKQQGVCVEFVNLQKNGEIDYDDLESKLDSTVSFISIMACCNETGAINDLRRVYELKQKYCKNAIFHSDGVQAFGKIKLNLDYLGVDLFTISGHKIHGPKGIGALYVRSRSLLTPIILGGGQEYNLRSGTENVAFIMALKKVIENFGNKKETYSHVHECFDAFIKNVSCSGVKINSFNSPYILSLSFSGVNGETLVHMMEQKDILISRGSACSSKKAGNRILENMGLSKDEILGSVRISFSNDSKVEECEYAGKVLKECYIKLKETLR